ncbi:pimeloyl-ACP methyl ester carboxylesterase [Larkinella arboricola]|uniref:Pimeloyl-ACP methyl ester carboxylesterase n=1 Tax=Larkinella arboricola TaxID=643671 RepID=A0A327WFH1_LARAB|nr:alpha/beta hydrolase [Larkinella arboricola]RAJ90039.1 pimeloyl-ACP methyl ester carboxylesterase [Larkinella arboricola]
MQSPNTADSYLDRELVKQLPGFTSHYLTVNGLQLHYVMGGQGKPLVLLPGWPQNWWSYHKLMPLLADRYQVMVVELRGMGGSDKPMMGYSKKEMAGDVAALLDELGIERTHIAGHDIGAAVAFSFAAHFPQKTDKLVLLDTPHPDENLYRLPMLPTGAGIHPWWVAFNQVQHLPEQLLEGRFHLVQGWLFDQLLVDKTAITDFDRQVYAQAYGSQDAIRASNGWYQTFPQDIEAIKGQRIESPTLGLAGPAGYQMLSYALPPYIDQLEIKEVGGSGHFVAEERPLETSRFILDFLG